ncbi:MAG: family 43 glycosylhydrolase [Planctomycetaceae bacterium]|nr:family 43 glycosylhydrolase [Planctomycetaceae bacterium]
MKSIRTMSVGIALLSGIVVFGGMCALADPPRASEPGSSEPANYARPFEPRTRPAFLPLPPGAVEPAGWLRDWCLAARDGFTGHMDQYDDEFKRAWAADHTMTGEGLFWYKGAWPYEGGGYWFDGLARLGYALHDDALIEQASRRLHVVAEHMRPDGLLFLWWLDRNNPADRDAVNAALGGWPLWASGLLGRAMTGYYAGSRDPQILQALETAYGTDADCLRSISGSMSNVWPAYDTYTWTGNQTIAAALTAMFDPERPGLQPNLNRYRTAPDMRPGSAVENQHVVEFLENTTPWAVAYLWTGDVSYLQAALGWHEFIERIAMQPHGVPVSDEWYVPTGAFRGSETCDVAGYVWSQVSLLAVSGDGYMADRAERAFFNAGAAAVSRDYKTHVYFQSPNRFANGSPDFPHGPRAGGGSYQPKHSPLCCTAALNRIVPYYVTHMWMATYDNGLAATCYGPCKITALAADRVPVEIACNTDYPFNETIEMSVKPSRVAEFPIYFRIPGWCTAPALTVNGVASDVTRDAQGFVRVSRSWKPGDTVRVHFPMQPLVQTGRDNATSGPYTGEHKPTMVAMPEEGSTQGAPYAAVSYGPLLFALAIPDTQDANTPDPAARWQFALDVQQPNISVERQAMPARWDWPLESPLKLKVNAVAIDWAPAPEAPALPAQPVVAQQPAEQVTLVPYGCTKFRISMFPVVAESERKATQAPSGQLLNEIRIRDPFVLPDPHAQTYYLVASSGDAITVRQSADLTRWGAPRTVFTKPDGCWGSGPIWAPEMHAYGGKYYLFATFMNDTPIGEQWKDWPPRTQRGTQVLVADSPLGPFQPFSNMSHTPVDEMALDGTLWVEEGVPYMVYCHEWVQIRDGTIKLMRLKDDLSGPAGEPELLFRASDASWTPRDRDSYVTDGPALYRSKSGKLFMLWSSFTDTGYTTGVVVSDSGKVAGPWRHAPEPLFRQDGGHAMIFRTFDGALMVSLHSPNRSPDERCHLFEVEDTGDTLRIVGTR